MKIGVLSDTHIHNEEGMEALKHIYNRHFSDVDLLFHAGDLVDLSVFEWLNQRVETIAVSGNMDYPEVTGVLPKTRIVKAGKFWIGLTHGQGPPSGLVERIKRNFMMSQARTKLDCIVYGHTHWTVNKVIDDTLFFNPGSATDQKFAPYNSIGFLIIDDKIEGVIQRI